MISDKSQTLTQKQDVDINECRRRLQLYSVQKAGGGPIQTIRQTVPTRERQDNSRIQQNVHTGKTHFSEILQARQNTQENMAEEFFMYSLYV